MYDASLVGMVHASSQYLDKLGSLGRSFTAAHRPLATSECRSKGAALDVLHHKVRAPILIPDLQYLHDVRVPELCDSLGFQAEANSLLQVGVAPLNEHLHGYEPVQV
jgi:hypothetical protein